MAKYKKYYMYGITLTEWLNENSPSAFTVQKSFKDSNGEWKNTESLNRNDLMNLRMLIDAKIIEDIKKSE